MEILSTIQQARAFRSTHKGKLGFVPTMGALHRGHLVLVEKSIKEADHTIVSVFVNKKQFNNTDDFMAYPRNIEEDIEILKHAGADAVFMPDEQEMYSGQTFTQLSFGEMAAHMEGVFRPGHFDGVGLVVSKLLNIVQPELAYFGEKDFQQLSIVRQLVSDLNVPVIIRSVATVREESGLALSSRNKRLSRKGREKAADIYKALNFVAESYRQGKKLVEVRQDIQEWFNDPIFKLEYLEVVNNGELRPLNEFSNKEMVACIAVYVENVRLIDNLRIS